MQTKGLKTIIVKTEHLHLRRDCYENEEKRDSKCVTFINDFQNAKIKLTVNN